MTTLSAVYELLTDIAEPWQPWRERANCIGLGPDMFLADRGESTREAKQVCRGCVVRTECLEFSMETNQRWGVWGGLSERQRRALRRERGGSEELRRTHIGERLSGTHPRRAS